MQQIAAGRASPQFARPLIDAVRRADARHGARPEQTGRGPEESGARRSGTLCCGLPLQAESGYGKASRTVTAPFQKKIFGGNIR